MLIVRYVFQIHWSFSPFFFFFSIETNTTTNNTNNRFHRLRTFPY